MKAAGLLLALLAACQSIPGEPYLLVLGTAQDGGLPQIGCREEACERARRNPDERRLVTSLAIVDPREGKLRRLKRTAEESLKQCGRSHLIEIGENMKIEGVLTSGARVIVADKSGAPYRACGDHAIAIVVGPEGGLTPAELETLRARGAIIADFGVHVMRIEVAAVAACAIVMHAERTRG